MINKNLFLVGVFYCTSFSFFLTYAQNINNFWKEAENDYASFTKESLRDYLDFREKANAEYEDFLRLPWSEKELDIFYKPTPDPAPDPIISPLEINPIKSKPITIDTIISVPDINPRPYPISPIKENSISTKVKKFYLYDILMQVREVDLFTFKINGNSNAAIADAWHILSKVELSNLLADCLKLREKYNLPDWSYFRLIDKITQEYYKPSSNEHALLMGFILAQSGYKIRFMLSNTNLYLLLGTKGIMFNRLGYKNGDTFFYTYNLEINGEGYICDVGFEGEKDFSLVIDKSPELGGKLSNPRILKVHDYPQSELSLSIDTSLLKLYDDYPNGTVDESVYSRWAIQGNTPASNEIKSQLYPHLIKDISGMSVSQAVHYLLRIAQSFEYGYDDEIWGEDRTFWIEESWYYSKSDCEDHAINFTRMVRDILDLDTALVYYPGHLAAAVAFPNEVPGDYIIYDGKRFTICDPTYFYANIGVTMPGMNNSGAVLIPLRKNL